MILRLRFIHLYRDRHGRPRTYLRRPGHKRVALPDQSDPGFLAAYQAAIAATDPPPAPVNRVPERSIELLVRDYYAHNQKFLELGPSTTRVYRRLIDGFVRRQGAKPVALYTADHIRQALAKIARTPAAANHYLRTIRALMQHAVAIKWRTDDPTAGITRLEEEGEGAETWTEEDIAQYEAYWPIGTKQRLALSLLIYTGQRRSDVVRLGPQNLRRGKIEVRPVKTRKRNKTPLLIPVHPELAAVLPTTTNHLSFLVTKDGGSYTPESFYNQFKKWVIEAGLPKDRSPHGLRKATCRRMAEGGCTAHQIMSITGHRKLSDVEIYTRDADRARMAEHAILHMGRPQKENTGG